MKSAENIRRMLLILGIHVDAIIYEVITIWDGIFQFAYVRVCKYSVTGYIPTIFVGFYNNYIYSYIFFSSRMHFSNCSYHKNTNTII